MAIFKRSKRRPLIARFRESVWPSMGWVRLGRYWWHRLFRRGDSTYRITAGLASGAAVSFSPLMGTHIFQGALLAWVLRGSFIAMLVGTIVCNPATLYFILKADYFIGARILEAFSAVDYGALPPSLTLSEILNQPLELLLPLVIGGYILALLVWVAIFALFYLPVDRARKIYANRRRKKELAA